jgi:hypothetical protein
MEAIILLFLRLMIPIAIFGGLAYFALGPGARWLARKLAGEPPYMVEARAVAARIGANLRGADPALAARCLDDLDALLERRLPRILEQYQRLTDHLAKTTEEALRLEEAQLRERLRQAEDAPLRAILEENLKLVSERAVSRRKMQLLTERTEAQLKQVLLYLEALESRSVSLGVGAPQDDVPREMVTLLEEVSVLEGMYREMDEVPAARVPAGSPREPEAPDDSRTARGQSRRRERNGGEPR